MPVVGVGSSACRCESESMPSAGITESGSRPPSRSKSVEIGEMSASGGEGIFAENCAALGLIVGRACGRSALCACLRPSEKLARLRSGLCSDAADEPRRMPDSAAGLPPALDPSPVAGSNVVSAITPGSCNCTPPGGAVCEAEPAASRRRRS